MLDWICFIPVACYFMPSFINKKYLRANVLWHMAQNTVVNRLAPPYLTIVVLLDVKRENHIYVVLLFQSYFELVNILRV